MPNADRLIAASAHPRTLRPNGMPQAAGRAPVIGRSVAPVLDQAFGAGDLAALRSGVAAYAAQQGAADRAEDVVLVAHELATNVIRHGGGRGRLGLWRDGHCLVCRVTDTGPGMTDAARTANDLPSPQMGGGRGLWIVRSLAAVGIESGPGGTAVVAVVPLP